MSRTGDDATSGLTTTSYAVLAQLAVRPWSTPEMAQQRVRYFRYEPGMRGVGDDTGVVISVGHSATRYGV